MNGGREKENEVVRCATNGRKRSEVAICGMDELNEQKSVDVMEGGKRVRSKVARYGREGWKDWKEGLKMKRVSCDCVWVSLTISVSFFQRRHLK